MKTSIVITSIFQPTEAIHKFSKLDQYDLIVVGDKKTPSDWTCDHTTFLPVDSDTTAEFSLTKVLPYNHYCRKMLGYLYAIKAGAEAIIDTDDDNIPKTDWSFPQFEGDFDLYSEKKGFVNIYKYYSDQHIWPRGLPLNLINVKEDFSSREKQSLQIGIWQGLADEDPDVDAIYRLTSDEPCYFNQNDPIALGFDTITPFNTQNTIIRKELFTLLYLPTYVTFRFTDILRGLIAQPIMWLYGYHLGFVNATVVQKRNPHDYYKDFVSEIPMYHHASEVIPLVQSVISKEKSIEENLRQAYVALQDHGIVTEQELVTLDAWLADIELLA
jgi:hypothetical protein